MRRLAQLSSSLLLVALAAPACARDRTLTPNMLAAGAAQSAGAGRDIAGGQGGATGAGGSAGSAAAPGSQADCSARASQASTALLPLLQDAASGCTRDADCAMISIDTLCHAACGWLATSVNVAAIEAAIAEQNAGICAQFVSVGCRAIIPPCVPPSGTPACKAGTCSVAE